MLEQIKTVLSKQLRIKAENIRPESNLKKDLGADSLALMEMALTLEDDYGVAFDPDGLAKIETVQDVLNYMESHK